MNDTELLLKTSTNYRSLWLYLICLKVEFWEASGICSLASKPRPFVFHRIRHKNILGLFPQPVHVFKYRDNAQVWVGGKEIKKSFQSWYWL